MMTLQSVYSEVEGCIIFTVIVVLGDESLVPHYVVTTAFAPRSFPFTQRPLFPFFRCITHLILLLFVTQYFQLSGGIKKKCINNLFLGRFHPWINGNTKTIYKDGRLKAIFDHFYCAQSLLPFCESAETQLVPSVWKLLLKEHKLNI